MSIKSAIQHFSVRNSFLIKKITSKSLCQDSNFQIPNPQSAIRNPKSKKPPIFNFLFGLFIFVFLTGFARAHTVPLELNNLVMEGKNHIYRLEFEEAEKLFRESQAEFPEYPQGYVYQAYITALFYALDQSNDSLAQKLEEQLQQAIEVAKDYKDRYNDSAGSYFHLALANSIKALYYIVDRSYVKGYWYGRKAKGDLNKVVEMDSTYYDAYIGLGLFHYYADLLPGFLKFVAGVLGFDGDRVKGKAEIELTATKGHYFKIESEFLFYSIGYFLEGDKDNSIRALQRMYQQYPTNQGLGVMIAYHYRRSGLIQQCIDMCEKLIKEEDPPMLPQITNLKYYNLALCYYDLNEFAKADSVLTAVEAKGIRKSLYYQASINYYRGHIADLHFDHPTALKYFEKIPDHKQTKYWYWLSRPFIKYPTDSLVYQYFIAVNLLGSRQFQKSMAQALQLKEALQSGETSPNPDIRFLAGDVLARNFYYQRQLKRSWEIYQKFIPDLDKMEDKLRRSWVYIHYYYLLREMGDYKEAEDMLKKADDIDDDFTRIIVEREKFILKKKYEAQAELKN